MTASDKKPYKILFVCLGNICRSPAAQGVLQSIIDRAGRAGEFLVDSAGTYSGHQGDLPDRRIGRPLHAEAMP